MRKAEELIVKARQPTQRYCISLRNCLPNSNAFFSNFYGSETEYKTKLFLYATEVLLILEIGLVLTGTVFHWSAKYYILFSQICQYSLSNNINFCCRAYTALFILCRFL